MTPNQKLNHKVDIPICKNNETLFDALKVLNRVGKGIVFIVNEDEKLCGLLTDGDIRRLFLGENDLQTLLKNVLSPEFVYGSVLQTHEEIRTLLNQKIKIIPLVDRDMKIVDYAEYLPEIHIPITQPDLNGNELKYLTEAFLSTWISSTGPYITRFENDFSKYCGVNHGVAVSNGTVALHLALLALGIGPGDEVVVPDLTFAATINAVLYTGATPVIVDVEEDSWCIDPQEFQKAITKKTKAVIPVHLYGQPCDMYKIMKIAGNHGVHVIEDCAEAHGAIFKDQRVGSFGIINCFSFYGNKIITTGEGGMCVTNSSDLTEKMRTLRDHGMSRKQKYWHETIGYNYRMTNLQAAIGCAQLERIDELLNRREEIENTYRRQLREISFVEFQRNDLPHRKKVTWLVSALVKEDRRETVCEKLRAQKIDVRYFFYPLSKMDIYKKYTFSNENSLKLSEMGINFPTSGKLPGSELIEILSSEIKRREKFNAVENTIGT